MARGGGVALKSLSWVLRAVEFCCAAVVLALMSYFLAKRSLNDLYINAYMKAVEGISGVAVLYTIAAVLLVCCLGGLGFFALLAFVLDLAFLGGFIYIAWEARHGASSCNGFVRTPLGSGTVGVTQTVGSLPSLKTACRMNTAIFAVAIVAIVFFLLSALVEIALWRHHKSEKKYGPGPANNYTTGSGNRKFWQRKNRNAAVATSGLATEKYSNEDALPAHTTPAAGRQSYNTEATAVGPEPVVYNKYGHVGNGGVGDGYVAPHGSAMNYGETARVPNSYQESGVTNEIPVSRY